MILCPFCQFRNEDGSLFCEQCKSDLGLVEPQAAPVAAVAVAAPPVAAVAVEAIVAVPYETTPPPVAAPVAAVAIETVAAVPYEGMPSIPVAVAEPAPPLAAVAVAEVTPAPVAAVAVAEVTSAPQAAAQVVEVAPPPPSAPVPAALVEALPSPPDPPAAEPLIAAGTATVQVAMLPDVVPPPPAEPAVEVVSTPSEEGPVVAVAMAAETLTASPTLTAPVTAPPAAVHAVQAAPVGTQPKLIVTRGLRIGIEYTIYEGHNFIGRMDEKPVDIDLEDQEAPEKVYSSRQHALISFENGQLMIEDLNSSNGTFVNRNRIYPGQSRALQTGDVIQIGTVQMKVKM